MKIAVLAAAGRSGRRITEEAVRRGHDVTAFVPEGTGLTAAPLATDRVIERSITALARADLIGFDAVIDCFGVWRESDAAQHTETLLHLAGILAGSRVHLLVVGGAGGLWADDTHTTLFHETAGFPADTRVVSAAQARSYEALRDASPDLAYTYLVPNGLYLPDAPRTGRYVTAGEELVARAGATPPLAFISYADLAVAMIDLAEAGAAGRRRISVYTPQDDGEEP